MNDALLKNVDGSSTNSELIELPLCIMTSGDTHEKTVALLKQHGNFSLKESQLFLMQQDKVPSFNGSECEFVLEGDGIETKPHGHGIIK